MASRRKEIVEFLVTELKKIDGQTSTFNVSYTYSNNLFNNVFRKLKFLDEVNDFPAIYISAGTEIRDFNSKSLTVATLDVTIRAYVFGEDNSQSLSDSLVQDIEHVVYSLGDNPDKGILDITIDNISTDEGLVTPYGLAEVQLTTVYRLDG
jgi:hypothetical protein|tara:strand:- start:6047 stop:6499 length:453 start_codon:yes stop_codon:yes gene_type:complete